MRLMNPSRRAILLGLSSVLMVLLTGPRANMASAEPYTFTPDDYIEYGIYFSEGRQSHATKLLTLRYGDITGWYQEYYPEIEDIPSPRQSLSLKTARGSVIVNRNENVGVTVTRDTYNERKRTGTKRLEVRFEKATCIDRSGTRSRCVAELLLKTNGPDRGTVRQRRILRITTSTGLNFTYRSLRSDGGKPLPPALRYSPAINNYAWEWRR